MKRYPLVQVGNPQLRTTCERLSKLEIFSRATQTVIERLKYTMREVDGVGLAAPQVGIQKELFVMRIVPTKFRPDSKRVHPYTVINPKIIAFSEEVESDWEGCFSVSHADLFARILRSSHITVQYLNDHAELVTKDLYGLEARIFQHEYDHIHGLVFLDRNPDMSTLMSANEYRAMRKS